MVREVGVPAALFAFCAVFPSTWVAATYLVVGQGHFLMAFLYQHRAGKMRTVRYIILAILTLAAAFWYFRDVGLAMPMLVVAATAFGLHFAVDEFYLHKEKVTWEKGLTIAGFGILYSTLMLKFASPIFAPVVPYAVGAALALILLRIFSSVPASGAERYLWLVQGLLVLLAVIFNLPGQVLAVIILLHCANWALAYGEKVRPNPVRARRYWTDTTATLAVATLLFTISAYGAFSVFQYLFVPMYWNAWAVAHFILSSQLAVGIKTPLG